MYIYICIYTPGAHRSEGPTVQFCDTMIFCGKAVLAACPNTELEDYPLSAGRCTQYLHDAMPF